MKVLLINPPGPFARAGSRWPHKSEGGFGYAAFPFWLAYTAALIEQAGFIVELKDCIALRWNMQQLTEHVNSFAPDLVIMETSAPSYQMDLETFRQLKLQVPAAAVGFHATALPEMHLNDGFEYVIRGEYELSALSLTRYVSGAQKNLPERGVASKQNPLTALGPLIEDLDTLPYPARHLTPLENYVDVFAFGRSVQMITSRGCKFNCAFCTEPLLYGRPHYRKRSPDNICDEIEHIIHTYHPDEIYFDDASFTNSEKHVITICKKLKERGIDIQWSCMADAKVSASTLSIMAETGCRAIKFGVESADQEVLSKIPKHVNLEDVRETIRVCKQLGIKTHATYVFGLPGENREKALKTIDFALSLGSDTAQFSIATPYPGTRFYKMVEDQGWLISKDWSLWGSTAVVEYPSYSREDIIEMCNLAVARWQRQMTFRKPASVSHYLLSAYYRGGIRNTARVLKEGLIALVRGFSWL